MDGLPELVLWVKSLGFAGGVVFTLAFGYKVWSDINTRKASERAQPVDHFAARLAVVENQIGRMAESILQLSVDTRETQHAIREALLAFSNGVTELRTTMRDHIQEDRESHQRTLDWVSQRTPPGGLRRGG